LAWRPRSEAALAEFHKLRAADGAWLRHTYGTTPPPSRAEQRQAALQSGADATPGDLDDFACSISADARDLTDEPWPHIRDASQAQLLSALLARTRREDDRKKLHRALLSTAAASSWPDLFVGRATVTAEEFRRACAQRIVLALQEVNGSARTTAPRSDDLAAMWAAAPAKRRVNQHDCWWASGAPNPAFIDPRLPPPELRRRTVNAAGLYAYHCRGCRHHDRRPDGSFFSEAAHWACAIHGQLLYISELHLPVQPERVPPVTLLREQTIESNPALALAGAEEVEKRIKSGSMVYAARDEPLIVVPSKLIVKRSLKLAEEAKPIAADTVHSPDIPRLLDLAIRQGDAIAASAIAFDRIPGCKAGTAITSALHEACEEPKVRLVACHNQGVNLFTTPTPLSFPTLEGLAGQVPLHCPDYSVVWNDHTGGYNALDLAKYYRRLCCVWHPTLPDIVLMPTSLDFGLSCAPFIFSLFTAMLQWNIVWWLGEDGWSIYYLDDNGCVVRADRVTPLLRELDEMASHCGYEYSGPKRQTGRAAVGLGRVLNLDAGNIIIRTSKLFHTLTLLRSVVTLIDAASATQCKADTVDSSFIESLTGTLGWLAWCSFTGMLHMGAFYYASRVASERGLIRLSRITGLREACQWWLDRAASGRLRGHRRMLNASIPALRIDLEPSYVTAAPRRTLPTAALSDADNVTARVAGTRADGGKVICLRGDAAKTAASWGALAGRTALWGRWHHSQRDWGAGGRELYWPLQVLLRLPELVHNAFVVIAFDNACDAVAVNWARARGRVERRLMTALFECAEDLGVELGVWWMSRRLNAWADELSKCLSPADARRWATQHGFELIICDDLRDDYIVGSLSAGRATS
jgi:hypothetical protein